MVWERVRHRRDKKQLKLGYNLPMAHSRWWNFVGGGHLRFV